MNNADPLNAVKLWVTGFFAIYTIFTLSNKTNLINEFIKIKSSKFFLTIVGTFILFLFFALISSGNKLIGLIGYTGRNNGFICYLALSIILTFIAISFRFNNLQDFFKVILILSLILNLYGFIQYFKLDLLKWSTPYNRIILTTGNPDFSSSLLAIISLLLCGYIFYSKKFKLKILPLLLIASSTILVYLTQAKQGIILLVIGFAIFSFVKIREKESLLTKFYGLIFLLGSIFFVLGMLNTGPLSKYLYKSSVQDRGFNWRAAWNMFRAHPLFGVGPDNFAGYFMQYRDKQYPLLYGYAYSSNNSHNVFLDFLATGGIFVGVAYIALLIFIFWRSLISLKKYTGNERYLILGIFAGWVSFVAQSIISIDNLALAIWGWVLGGILVALSNNVEIEEVKFDSVKKKISANNPKLKIILGSFSLLFAVVLSYVAYGMYQAETKYSTFLKIQVPTESSALKIYDKIALDTYKLKFQNSDYRIFMAFKIVNSGNVDLGLSMFKDILARDPRRHDAATFISSIYEQQKKYSDAITYRNIVRNLNPYGADSLLELTKDYKAIGDTEAAKKIANEIIAMAPGTQIAKDAAKIAL